MQYITAVSRSSSVTEHIKRALLESNPVLEGMPNHLNSCVEYVMQHLGMQKPCVMITGSFLCVFAADILVRDLENTWRCSFLLQVPQ